MAQLFVDLDGVLADFDGSYERLFGVRPSIGTDNVDWKNIEGVPNFYRHLFMKDDAFDLWSAIKSLEPTILTGIPSSIPSAAADKRGWVKDYFGASVPIITCLSKEKCLHAQPGDVLIDDWEKYRQLWEDCGGVWITHLNAELTIQELKRKGMI